MSGGGTHGRSRDSRHRVTPHVERGEPDCDITDKTNLNSPNPVVVTTLKVNDILTIELDAGKPERLVAKTGDGEIAGAITSDAMLGIVNCIRMRFEFIATVLSINNGRVEVLICRRKQ